MTSFGSNSYRVTRYAIPLFYIGFLLFASFTVVNLGVSRYFRETAERTLSRTHALSAIEYQPDDPDVYDVSGKLLLNDSEFVAAAEAYEQAISLCKDDFHLWLGLGYSRSRLKNFAAAQTAYEKAITLAPSYSKPLAEMGKMLLHAGERDRAFQFLTKAAEIENHLYPEILHMASTEFSDNPIAIEYSVNPSSLNGRKIVARYMLERGFVTENVRTFLSGNELNESEKNEIVEQLMEIKDLETALIVWASGLNSGTFDNNQLIYDGGFEYLKKADKVGFGWLIDDEISATSVTVDNKDFHTGAGSVSVKFAGNVDFNRSIMSQIIKLEPRRSYTLKYFVLSHDLVSAGLPSIIIREQRSDRILAQSSDIRSTAGNWIESKLSIETSQSSFVRISLQRTNCFTSPCPIFGEILLDDFSIVRN